MDEEITAHNDLAILPNAQVEQEGEVGNHDVLTPNGPQSPRRSGSSGTNLKCTSCDDVCDSGSFIATCRHAYCKDCIAAYVQSALVPSGTFPPIYCKIPITIQNVREHLPKQLVSQYKAKQREIAEACSLLCAEPGCRCIIEEEDIVADLGHCLACNRYTCTKCRTPQHERKECPTDAEREEVLKLAKDNKWQACYQCNNMIELNFGCYHITCICRAEFCYVCGIPWKQCACTWFADDHVDDYLGPALDAYEAPPFEAPQFRRRTVFRADRALARYEKHLKQTWGKPDERPREEQLEEVRAAIETGCDHSYWRRIRTVDKDHPGHCKLCKSYALSQEDVKDSELLSVAYDGSTDIAGAKGTEGQQFSAVKSS